MIHFRSVMLATGLVLAAGMALAGPAKPLKKCATLDQPGPYELAGNIVTDSSPCFEITAPGVVLDLGGYTIEALPGDQAIKVITGANERETTVRNGLIRGNFPGVLVELEDASRVEGLLIRNGLGGGTALKVGDRSIVRGNVIVDLADVALEVACPSVVVQNALVGQKIDILQTGGGCAFDQNAQ